MKIAAVKFYLVLTALGSCCTLQAQDSTLSVWSEQFRQQYDFFAKEAISQPLLTLDKYALLFASYSVKDGGYKLAQEAAREKDARFFTEGTKQVGKFRVSAFFGYQHSAQDSLPYTLRNDPEETAPYYFYAAKNGNWEKGRYELQGIVSRPLNNDRFTLAAGVNYNAINAWRSNDPRPEYFAHSMKGMISLQYRIAANHSLSAQATLHNKSCETSIEYRNQDYSLSLLYAEYVNYLQYGYGFSAVHTTNRQMRTTTKGLGWNALYHGKFSFGNITVKGGYRALDNHFNRPASAMEADVKYGSYYEDLKNVSALWQYKKSRNAFSLQADYFNHLGRDFNTLLNANNYVYSFEQLKIAPLWGRYNQANELKYEVGLEASLDDLFRADGASAVTTDYQNAGIALLGNWYTKTAPSQLLKLGLKTCVRLPVSSLVTQPSQQSDFIKSVVFQDAYYQQANTVKTSAEILYNFYVQKLHPYIKFQGQYVHATLQKSDVPNDFLPGRQRWTVQCSIGIIL